MFSGSKYIQSRISKLNDESYAATNIGQYCDYLPFHLEKKAASSPLQKFPRNEIIYEDILPIAHGKVKSVSINWSFPCLYLIKIPFKVIIKILLTVDYDNF